MSVDVSNLVKFFGTTPAVNGVSFSVPEGAFLALLGPSGSGKTTVLRMLAGLEHPDDGRIDVHGQTVFTRSREMPAEDRDIGMVFQDYALWPHMTVAQNIAFGLRLRRLSRSQTAARVADTLAMVRLHGLDARYPDQLSGGQQQRVAIARALAMQPRLLLLDEPLSNLDAALREEMRLELVRLLKAQGITAIYVTHDRIEALAMADQIVVMRQGQIAQIGTPEELYTRPTSTFIAAFLGAANFITGDVQQDSDGQTAIRHGTLRVYGTQATPLVGQGIAMMRPEDGLLSTAQPQQEGLNNLLGTLIHSEFLGAFWRHVVQVSDSISLHVQTPQRAPAERVWLSFPRQRCVLFPDTGPSTTS